MKYEHILNPVTDGGKLMQLLRSYQHDLACGKTSTDPKQVADLLLWFDDQNEKLKIPSKTFIVGKLLLEVKVYLLFLSILIQNQILSISK